MDHSFLISNLSHALRELRGVKALLRVGLKRSSAKGKIDLLAICDDGSIERYSSLIKTQLKDRWPTGNFFVCDDSVRFDLPTGSGGIAVCDSSLLVRQVEEWTLGRNLGGQHRPWATGYWLPEALCGDLATAKTLYDVTGISVQIKELLVPYPAQLSEFIIKLCTDEIKQKISMLENLYENATIELEMCLSDVMASVIRLAFARSRKYFRGFRSLGQQTNLLRSSDHILYELALKLSRRKRVKDVVGEIDRLL